MRIAILAGPGADQTGSTPSLVAAVLRHMPAGMRVCIYAQSDVDVLRPRRLLRQLADDRVDVVHLSAAGPGALTALVTARRLQVPTVSSFDTDLVQDLRASRHARWSSCAKAYLRYLYGRSVRIVTWSCAAQRELVSWGLDARRIAVCRHGVDPVQFAPTARSTTLREHWRVCDRRPAIIYAGSLSSENGLPLLRGIEDELYRRRVAHRFVIVGDGAMRNALLAQLPDAVFTGALGSTDRATAIASSDVFVVPADTSAAARALPEAQACGLAAVVPARAGAAEYVLDDLTGFTCASGNASAFADRLAMLLRDRSSRARFGERARERALTMSWDHVFEPLWAAYRAAFAVRPAGTMQSARVPGNATSR